MVSSLTHEGAQVTLQAMEAGAVDYLTKDMRAWMGKSESLNSDLISRIIALGKSKNFVRSSFLSRPKETFTTSSGRDAASVANSLPLTSQRLQRPIGTSKKPALPAGCKVVAIGSSTGGPAALQEILTKLPADFPVPILLIQHMPNTFTSVFAERLNQQCNIEVKHAESGDRLKPGRALLAPGGKQMMVDGSGTVQILDSDDRMTYKPSVDVTFASVAKVYSSKVLAVVLTGMGADGRDGAKLLKAAGSTVWGQSESTCTIYGMPQAVAKEGLVDNVVDLGDFAACLSGVRF